MFRFFESLKRLIAAQELYVRWGLIVASPVVVILILAEYVRRLGGYLFESIFAPIVTWLGFSAPQSGWVHWFLVPVLALTVTLIGLWLLGFIVKRRFISVVYTRAESVVTKVPLLGMLYESVKNGVAAFLNYTASHAESVEIPFGTGTVLGTRTHQGKHRSVVAILSGNVLMTVLVRNNEILIPKVMIPPPALIRLSFSGGFDVPESVAQLCDQE
jgi:uncharacterized membrane protein